MGDTPTPGVGVAMCTWYIDPDSDRPVSGKTTPDILGNTLGSTSTWEGEETFITIVSVPFPSTTNGIGAESETSQVRITPRVTKIMSCKSNSYHEKVICILRAALRTEDHESLMHKN